MPKKSPGFPVQITVPLKGDTALHDALHRYAKDKDRAAAAVARGVLRNFLIAEGYYIRPNSRREVQA